MSEQTVNIPLLRKAVEWAEAEAAKPEGLREWEQNYYAIAPSMVDGVEKSADCGTCYCIAGFAAHQVAEFKRPNDEHSVDDRHIITIAREALGLQPFEAGALFHYGNTIENVRRIAEDIAGERL